MLLCTVNMKLNIWFQRKAKQVMPQFEENRDALGMDKAGTSADFGYSIGKRHSQLSTVLQVTINFISNTQYGLTFDSMAPSRFNCPLVCSNRAIKTVSVDIPTNVLIITQYI